jgi:aspartyl-tRNA(Asn)/glutamyl-tRNA(Gln) amidotransferase subunit B
MVRNDRRQGSFVIDGEAGPFELVIGLEVHAQLVSRSKLFSGASTEFGPSPMPM